MSFWSWWFPDTTTNPDPGSADGVELAGDWTPTESRGLPSVLPSPWAGWPAEWNVPNWDFGSRFNELIDVAWMCLDINSRIVSSMPVYRTIGGEVVSPVSWMSNPDPTIYTGWSEFIKQYVWDYLLGEVFVLPMTTFADDRPMTFRVVPPWVIDVQMGGGRRIYRLGPGGRDVSDEILHVRYQATTGDPHGTGPLANAGGRMLTAGVLAKYVREVASTGGDAGQTLETDEPLTREDAQEVAFQWIESRVKNAAHPPVLGKGLSLKDHKVMAPRDMALLELAQFTESRIAQLLGVPPFLAGLPATGGGDGNSMTYSNVSQLFDYHDRSALRPYSNSLMEALSNWALPRGQAAELNRDEYSRPAFNERAAAWAQLIKVGVDPELFLVAERLTSSTSAQALTGATLDGSEV